MDALMSYFKVLLLNHHVKKGSCISMMV